MSYDRAMSDSTERKRRRGRPAGSRSGVEKYTVSLDPDDAEWAKVQLGGLSETLRRLLREAREKARAGS